MTNGSGHVLLGTSQIDAAVAVLGRAFVGDPFVGRLYPDAENRPRLFAKTAACVLRYAMRYGEVHAVSPSLEGVAAWFPPDHVEPSLADTIRCGFLWLPLFVGIRPFRKILMYMDHTAKMRRRHASGPHWYLQLLGVDPMHQGSGCGGRLLRAMLARLDREGVPCCLDTENEKNVALYEHFGFRVREASEIPGSGCPCWLMTRAASK